MEFSSPSAGVAGQQSLDLYPSTINRKDIDIMDRSFLECQHLLNSVLVVVAIYTQLVTLLVASMAQGQASWNDAEVESLVDFFWEIQSKGEGGNFKDDFYRAAADHIAPEWTSGPVKVGKHCKSKWASVSLFFLFLSSFDQD